MAQFWAIPPAAWFVLGARIDLSRPEWGACWPTENCALICVCWQSLARETIRRNVPKHSMNPPLQVLAAYSCNNCWLPAQATPTSKHPHLLCECVCELCCCWLIMRNCAVSGTIAEICCRALTQCIARNYLTYPLINPAPTFYPLAGWLAGWLWLKFRPS